MPNFKYKKAIQALNFFTIKEGGAINKMKALKLIWLADRYHLRNYGKLIIGDCYLAMKYGTVASNTKDYAYTNHAFRSEDEIVYNTKYLDSDTKLTLKSKLEIDDNVFATADLSTMELVYTKYGKYNEFELSDISHLYPEWKKHKSEINGITRCVPINYLDFFENPTDKLEDIFDQQSDMLDISKETFQFYTKSR